jgi:hypothetical protein
MDKQVLQEMGRLLGVQGAGSASAVDVDMVDSSSYEMSESGGANTASRAAVDPTVGRISASGRGTWEEGDRR